MTTPLGRSSSVPSLPPPSPKSPPEYPDLYGKRREMARLQMLEREISFLEEELKSIEGLQPTSRYCKEIVDFVVANSDPLLPTNKKNRGSCRRFWKWLCRVPSFNMYWICCCCCDGCYLHLKLPQKCCDCKPCACSCVPSSIICSLPKWRCCSCPKPQCSCLPSQCCGCQNWCIIPSCCKFQCPTPICPSCCTCKCSCSCSCPSCPIPKISSCCCTKSYWKKCSCMCMCPTMMC